MSAWWLAEVTAGGQVWRYTDGPTVVVETRDGEELRFAAGLEPLTIAQGDEDVAIEFPLHEDLVEDDLELCDVVVYRWREGTALEAAAVFARGRGRGASVGRVGELVQLGVETVAPGTELPVLVDSARVDSTTWPLTGSGASLPPEQEGVPYPLILGYPGYDGTSTPRAVVPVALAQLHALNDADTLVPVSDRLTDMTRVYLVDFAPDAPIRGWQSVVETADELGQVLMVADFTRTSANKPADDADNITLHAGFHPTYGGGKWRSAYDVICGLLRERAPDTVDWSRMPELEAVLGLYQVDSWIDAQVYPWEWIRSVLLPFLPVVERQGQRGRYLAVQRWHASTSRVVLELDADRGDASRTSRRELDSSGIANEITVLYRPQGPTGGPERTHSYANTSAAGPLKSPLAPVTATVLPARGDYLARWTITGDRRVAARDPSAILEPLAVRSFQRYRTLPTALVELDWCWDEATALRVGRDRLEQFALPRSYISYRIAPHAIGDELPSAGDEVLINDTEMRFDGRLAVISEPPLVGPGGVSVTLRLPPA